MGMGKETWEPIAEAIDEDELEREAYERNARFDEEAKR